MHQFGIGIKENYLKAKKYYELAGALNNADAFFYLGHIYLYNKYFEIDIHKAMQYFERCYIIHCDNYIVSNKSDASYITYYRKNNFHYQSCNDLGLIYLITFNDINKATKYIKEAAFAEYSFGQNNLGLLNQFYLKNIAYAEYMYQKSARNNFPLAYFNLAQIKEKNGNIKESIEFYIQASNNINEPLLFHNNIHFDYLYYT